MGAVLVYWVTTLSSTGSSRWDQFVGPTLHFWLWIITREKKIQIVTMNQAFVRLICNYYDGVSFFF